MSGARGRVTLLVLVAACGRIGFDDRDSGVDTASCTNAIRDGSEMGIDCGGSCALACPGATCGGDSECVTGSCVVSTCELASGPPSWRPGPQMIFARVDHACARIGTSVHVLGGEIPGGNATEMVEILSPQGNFIAGPGMLSPRRRHIAIATTSGDLYALGGYDLTATPLTSLERLRGGAWFSVMSTPGPHAGFGGAEGPDGRLYIVDNIAFEFYTPSTDSWSADTPVTDPRDSLGVATGNDGRVYAVGGLLLAGLTPSSLVDAWDIQQRRWARLRPLAIARRSIDAVAAPDGRIYAVGGVDSSDAALASVEAYSPDHDRWVAAADLAEVRAGLCVTTAADGRILAIGGADQASNSLRSTEYYGPTASIESTIVGATGMARVEATNFAANANLSVFAAGQLLATGLTDDTGAATLTFASPGFAPGSYDVTAVDAKSQYPVTTVLDIL